VTVLRRVQKLLEPGEFEHLAQVAEWLRRPLLGVVVDEVRRQHGRYKIDGKHRVNRTVELLRLDDVDPKPGPADRLIQTEDADRVLSQVRAMPDARRAVVELRIQGLSQKEIAQQLGCTVWNVDYHMTLARRELEKTYG